MRGYCTNCLTMRSDCVPADPGLFPTELAHVHRHRVWCERRQGASWFTAYRNEQAYRIALGLAEYDQISLPSKGRLPVPIAIHIIGAGSVASIPMDRQGWVDAIMTDIDPEREVELAMLARAKQLKRCRYVRARDLPAFDRRDRV